MSRSKGLGRYLSYVLRHNPAELNLELEAGGWVSTRDLLAALQASRPSTTVDDLHEVVREDSKGRFSLSDDGERIRANQGHSVEVDLDLVAKAPPPVLYHGTSADLLSTLLVEGLRKMQRHHVHLSADPATALQVARRRSRPVVLTVSAGQMASDGVVFFLSTNGVWLVESVGSIYLSVFEP